jgi:hypothetical protein
MRLTDAKPRPVRAKLSGFASHDELALVRSRHSASADPGAGARALNRVDAIEIAGRWHTPEFQVS